ncbi:SH3 domain-containing protein 2-like [Pyrus x bretschneideri]|uniref:SH3 domain-containing protein 2-like n=1 Tax=Pyrus x bretschneideri TaxID=225117 RepID=UPI00202DBA00|nr:SH3 domain-containing protein 2-like [Pyrus x bretschneideri]
MKLEAAEAKLQELQSSVAILGKEASATMAAVEGQQQRLTLQRLLAMSATIIQNILQILDQLEGEILSEKQQIEASHSPHTEDTMPPPPSYEDLSRSFASETYDELTGLRDYFLGEVMYTFHAVTDVVLSLSFGDYVVVRKRRPLRIHTAAFIYGTCSRQHCI